MTLSTRAPRARRSRRITLTVAFILLLVTALFGWPVVMVIYGAFQTGTPGRSSWSLTSFFETLADPATAETLLNSVVFTGITALVATALGLVMAFLVARTNAPMRKIVSPVMLIVLAMPSLFYAIGWDLIAGPGAGSLNRLVDLVAPDAQVFNVESWPGLIFVSTLKLTSLTYFLLIGPFIAMDPAQEEAALMAGASKLRTFFLIHIPALAPAVISTAVLAVILGLEFFDIPLILGTPAGIEVFATQIYANLNSYIPPKYAGASTIAMILIAILLVLLAIQARLLKGRRFTTVSGKMRSRPVWDLGGWRWLAGFAIVLYAVLALVAPVVQLFIGSLQSYLGIYKNFTFNNYVTLFKDDTALDALALTGILALACGFAVTLLALAVTYVLRHFPGFPARYVRLLTWLPWAVPGTALVLGIFWAYLTVPALQFLYGTLALLIIGLVIAGTPIAMRTIEPAMLQIAPELEEAAWTSGVSRGRAFVIIAARLILPSFLAGWTLAGILIAGNLAVPLLLAGVDHLTVPVLGYDLYTQGHQPISAALFCLIAGILLAGYLIIQVVRVIVVRIATRPVPPAPEDPLALDTPVTTPEPAPAFTTAEDR